MEVEKIKNSGGFPFNTINYCNITATLSFFGPLR